MKKPSAAVLLLFASLVAVRHARADVAPPAHASTFLAGAWSGTLSHAGETTTFALELDPGDDEAFTVKMTVPAVHVVHQPIGRVKPKIDGDRVTLGPFVFTMDRAANTLSGTIPEGLVPVYALPVTLHKVATLDVPPRPELDAPSASPAWVFDAHSPLWAGAVVDAGMVYAGDEDGRMHALDAATGKERWSTCVGGAIRTRASLASGALFFQSDDGFLHRLDARSGAARWSVRVTAGPIVRRPPNDPRSRYDRFGADVTVETARDGAPARLYVGTHGGKLLALDATSGKTLWEFETSDSILAAPALHDGTLFFGSFDGRVIALSTKDGRPRWSFDTRRPVVSTPAVDHGVVVVGSRSYDLLGLDEKTGDVRWSRYVWFSWVESSAVVRDGVAYVGSSDSAELFAFDVKSGRRLFASDVHGWAWGQPAVTQSRVYVGTSATKDYVVGHRGGAVALDRATGRAVWRFDAPDSGAATYGFPGSAAAGGGLVFLTGLDGRVYAFRA